jgi:NAD-dependent dihydropyrimidine dehydrogenase PreA subunit/DNA-binding transcriptional ArsR family regulator
MNAVEEIDPIYKELAAKIHMGESKYVPLLFEKLATVEQARIMRELPDPPEEISRKLNLDKETIDKHLQEMYEKGLITRTSKGIRFIRSIVQMHDATLSNPQFDLILGYKFFDLWNAFVINELADITLKKAPQWASAKPIPGKTTPGSRVIPKWKSIKDIPGILPCEDIRQILKEYETSLAVRRCTCTRSEMRAKSFIPEEVCFLVGKSAEWGIEQGSARKITRLEALDIFDQIEKYPFVHMSYNEKRIARMIGNVPNYCIAFKMSEPTSIGGGFKESRFKATVDPDKCVGCKTCIGQCLFDAARIKYYPDLGADRAYIDTQECKGCGNCVVNCAAGARTMVMVHPENHIPDEFLGGYD